MNTVEKNIREENMYGCTVAAMKESIEGSLTFKLSGPVMIVASLMSDAQEEIAHNMKEDARQTLNRAKWVLSTYIDWKAGDKKSA
jgi:hypothetical protein